MALAPLSLIDPLDHVPNDVAAVVRAARDLCALAPGYALVQLRAAASLLTEAWLRRAGRDPSNLLHRRIEQLAESQVATQALVESLTSLRLLGNLAAHPEQRTGQPVSTDEALLALEAVHNLAMDWSVRAGEVPLGRLAPFQPPERVPWAKVCERAVFDRDAESMMALGLHLVERGDKEIERQRAEKKVDTIGMSRAQRWHRDALVWFERHHEVTGSPVSAFQVAWINLEVLQRRDGSGLDYLSAAAFQDNADALFLLGRYHLQDRGPLHAPVDLAEGLRLLVLAADQEHPEALYLLAWHHDQGIGVEKDQTRALQFVRRAADAGYPQAKVVLAEALIRQGEPSRYQAEVGRLVESIRTDAPAMAAWIDYLVATAGGRPATAGALAALEQAASSRLPTAELELARRLLDGERVDADIQRAAELAFEVLARQPEAPLRVQARQVLVRVQRAEHKVTVEALLSFHLPVGLWLNAGDDLAKVPMVGPPGLAEAMGALGRVQGMIAEPATAEDVHLLHRVLPRMDVRWTGTRAVASGMRRPPTPSRNALCPCGSGRKWKSCCGSSR